MASMGLFLSGIFLNSVDSFFLNKSLMTRKQKQTKRQTRIPTELKTTNVNHQDIILGGVLEVPEGATSMQTLTIGYHGYNFGSG